MDRDIKIFGVCSALPIKELTSALNAPMLFKEVISKIQSLKLTSFVIEKHSYLFSV